MAQLDYLLLLLPMLTQQETEDILLLRLLGSQHDDHKFASGEHLKYERLSYHTFNSLSEEECLSRFR